MPTALITGISGQDGHFLARQLCEKGFSIVGLTSRPDHVAGISKELIGLPVQIEHFDFMKPGLIRTVFERVQPDMVFNFAAKSTGIGMFDNPREISRLNGEFVLDILDAIKELGRDIRFCQASSAEMYGHVTECPQDETSAFRPKSPYGAAKLYAHNLIGVYRDAFDVHCSSAILYNHESHRRSPHFVTRKISKAVAEISLGHSDRLELGSLNSKRDWGYAPEYVDAMYLMAKANVADDYVLSTGKVTSVEQLCEMSFKHVGLDFRDYVHVTEQYSRPIETAEVIGDSSLIKQKLGWSAQKSVREIITGMIDYDISQLKS